MDRFKNPVIAVRHADLESFVGEDSPYRKCCPQCFEGILLVRRDEKFGLLDHDRCLACGQAFRYTDATIGGEPVSKVAAMTAEKPAAEKPKETKTEEPEKKKYDLLEID